MGICSEFINLIFPCEIDIKYTTFASYLHCFLSIGDNAVTSSIRIVQVFPELVGKKTRAIWKVYGGMLKYIIN